MTDALKIVLEKGDHWSLGILLFAILVLGLLRLPAFSELTKTHGYKVMLNFLWAIVGLTAFYILIVLIRDMSKDQKEIELARIEASLKTIKEKPEIIKADSSLAKLFRQTSNIVFPSASEPHPIENKSIDHSKCWIKIDGYSMTHLVKKPNWKNEGIIANQIPPGIYYILDKKREREFNKLFFQIELGNGLKGWVMDYNFDKNPKCYD